MPRRINPKPVTPHAVRHLERLVEAARQQIGNLHSHARNGNIGAAALCADWLVERAQALATELRDWPQAVGGFRMDTTCPECGGREVRAFNLFTLDSPAFHLCECGYDWPARKLEFYGAPGPGPGLYAVGQVSGGPALLLLAAISPADAATMFQGVRDVALTFDRETPEDWQFSLWRDETGPADRVQMRYLRPLGPGEELSDVLDGDSVTLPLAHGWTAGEDDDDGDED